jgi:AcrR family transcriptional regulator
LAGLRGRKKEESRHRIIAVAGHLFAEHGLDSTTMEDIAAAADVSVGTLYNYFGSKTALLLAAVDEDTDEMVARGAAILAKPGNDATRAVARLFATYADALYTWDRGLLQEVMSASFRRGGANLTAELAQMDMRLIEQLVALLEPFRQRGAIRSDVPAGDAALLLYSVLATQLFIYLSLDGISKHAFKLQLNRQIGLVFGGLASIDEKAKEE